MKEIKMSSGIVYLIDFDVVREKASPFPCYRKDNYIVKHPPYTHTPDKAAFPQLSVFSYRSTQYIFFHSHYI